MKKILIFFFAFVFCNFFLATGILAKQGSFAPEEIIVKFDFGATMEKIGNLNQKFGVGIKEYLSLPSTFVLKVPLGQEKRLAEIFSSLPMVQFAEPNFESEALFSPNDTYFNNQWGLPKVMFPQAWDISQGEQSTRIAIVDTGIDKDHPDLSGEIVLRKNFSMASSDDDLNGHGTHVAGIAAAITNNNQGVAGGAFKAGLLSIKVLNDSGRGYNSGIANGLVWAADNGARVINLSLGGGSPSQTLEDAINYAWNKGAVVNCAAGNNGNANRMYPAYYNNCIAVAATDSGDKKTSWSNFGNWVDVAAPGIDIFSTLPNHKNKISSSRNYGSISGTSMATSFVTGLAGLIFSKNPGLTNSQVRQIIEETADQIEGTGDYWVFGRINAYQSLLKLSDNQNSPTPTSTPTPIESLPTPTPVIPTSTPTPKPIVPTSTPTPKPTVTPTPKPWYCNYWPNLCK